MGWHSLPRAVPADQQHAIILEQGQVIATLSYFCPPATRGCNPTTQRPELLGRGIGWYGNLSLAAQSAQCYQTARVVSRDELTEGKTMREQGLSSEDRGIDSDPPPGVGSITDHHPRPARTNHRHDAHTQLGRSVTIDEIARSIVIILRGANCLHQNGILLLRKGGPNTSWTAMASLLYGSLLSFFVLFHQCESCMAGAWPLFLTPSILPLGFPIAVWTWNVKHGYLNRPEGGLYFNLDPLDCVWNGTIIPPWRSSRQGGQKASSSMRNMKTFDTGWPPSWCLISSIDS
jgi:hypothetical protein